MLKTMLIPIKLSGSVHVGTLYNGYFYLFILPLCGGIWQTDQILNCLIKIQQTTDWMSGAASICAQMKFFLNTPVL